MSRLSHCLNHEYKSSFFFASTEITLAGSYNIQYRFARWLGYFMQLYLSKHIQNDVSDNACEDRLRSDRGIQMLHTSISIVQ